jgi:glycosyltransferase involved in cell wall biosynthesis
VTAGPGDRSVTRGEEVALPSSLQIVGDSSYGGGGYLLVEWCRWLRARGARVDAVATDPVIVARLRALGVEVITDIRIPRDITPRVHARALRQLVSHLRAQRYDVVHTYTATPGVLGRIAARLCGVPVILHHQAAWTVDDRTRPLTRAVFTLAEQVAARAGTAAICVSDAVRDAGLAFRLAPASRLVVVHNGIDIAPFLDVRTPASRAAARESLGLDDATFTIGITARLSADKDVAAVLAVLGELVATLAPRPVRVVVAGDGPERDRLTAVIARDALPVSLLGFRDDVRPVLAAADVWLSTTRREGLSISLLEAMAAACPVVASAIAPNAEVLRDGLDGLLVPLDAPAALRDSLLAIARDEWRASALGASAAERVRAHYTLTRMFEETWALYAPAPARAPSPDGAPAVASSR